MLKRNAETWVGILLALMCTQFFSTPAKAEDTKASEVASDKTGSVFLDYNTDGPGLGIGLEISPQRSQFSVEGAYYFSTYEDEGDEHFKDSVYSMWGAYEDIHTEFEITSTFAVRGAYFLDEKKNGGSYLGTGFIGYTANGNAAISSWLLDADASMNGFGSSIDLYVGFETGEEYAFDIRLGYLVDNGINCTQEMTSSDIGTSSVDYELPGFSGVYLSVSIGYRF